MEKNLQKIAAAISALVFCGALLGTPVFAQIPQTGDGAGSLIPIMAGLLGVSLVLVIVYFVLSKKKK